MSSKILSNKDVLKISNEGRKVSKPFLTKYEEARLIGLRCQQLTCGALPLIDTTGMTSYLEIAEEELRQKKSPFIVKRRMPNGKFEYWKIEDLIQLNPDNN